MLSLATWFAVTKFFGAKQQVDDVIDEGNDVVDENLEEINCLPGNSIFCLEAVILFYSVFSYNCLLRNQCFLNILCYA